LHKKTRSRKSRATVPIPSLSIDYWKTETLDGDDNALKVLDLAENSYIR
jgi:hypothetical protein